MSTTDLVELHNFGLTFHQTGPLRQAGIDTVEKLAKLVDKHDAAPEGSRLASLPSMGTARVRKVCDAVHAWQSQG